MASLIAKVLHTPTQRHAANPGSSDLGLPGFNDEPSDCKQTANNETTVVLELADELYIAARKSTGTGSYVCQLISKLVGLPSKCRVTSLHGLSLSKMRLDLMNLDSSRLQGLYRSRALIKIGHQVSVSRLSRRPPPCSNLLKNSDDVRVVDVQFNPHSLFE
jgi:hypothetical protein